MKKILTAIYRYLKTLLAPMDPILETTVRGDTVLMGWTQSPEEELRKKLASQKAKSINMARGWLYCFEGANRGEVYPLSQENLIIGLNTKSDICLTPSGFPKNFHLRVLSQKTIEVVAEKGSYFKLNHKDVDRSEIIDYDLIEIEGNKLLFLENAGLQ
jgi:hypothetical protein